MQIFEVKVEPLGASGPAAKAIVVAQDARQAIATMHNDGRFSGYRLPPVEMTPCSATRAEVREALGAAATHETGVYAFALLEPPDKNDPNTPPAAVR